MTDTPLSSPHRLRVVFMGTPEFAVPSLEAILREGYDVPLVVSVPDKPKGRGRKLSPSPVKQRAEELGLPVATPERLRDPEFIELLRSVDPDVICVVAFRILPEEVYAIPRLGSFNLHGSLLPKYRGAAPINRAIMAGESQTGVTTFFLQRSVDTGDVILRRAIPIGPETTAGELHDVMMHVGAEAVADTLARIEQGEAHPLAQNNSEATPAPKIFRDDCRIDWNLPAETLHNFVRGLSPYPGAFATWNDQTVKVLRTCRTDSADLDAGAVRIGDGKMFVGTGDGDLEILELQVEGRKGLATDEFLRGARELPERFG